MWIAGGRCKSQVKVWGWYLAPADAGEAKVDRRSGRDGRPRSSNRPPAGHARDSIVRSSHEVIHSPGNDLEAAVVGIPCPVAIQVRPHLPLALPKEVLTPVRWQPTDQVVGKLFYPFSQPRLAFQLCRSV